MARLKVTPRRRVGLGHDEAVQQFGPARGDRDRDGAAHALAELVHRPDARTIEQVADSGRVGLDAAGERARRRIERRAWA